MKRRRSFVAWGKGSRIRIERRLVANGRGRGRLVLNLSKIDVGPKRDSNMSGEQIRAHCNQCGRNTNHHVLYTVNDDEFEENWWSSSQYRLIRCAGCDGVHLRNDYQFSEDSDAEGNAINHTSYFPPSVSRRKPAWMSEFPTVIWMHESDIGQILNEVYVSIQNSSYRLAAMGIRAALEMVMIENIDRDTNTFSGNIAKFFERGFVSVHQQPLFRNALIEAGHAAMHRGYKPTERDLSALLDMTEALIAAIYVHPARAQAVSQTIPVRQIASKRPEPGK